jgi:transposase
MNSSPRQHYAASPPPYRPELNPQENLWDEIREKIFKNYALKSMEEVYAKFEEAAVYIERNPALVKSITPHRQPNLIWKWY